MQLKSLMLSLSLLAFAGAATADDAKKARADAPASKPAMSQSGAASAGQTGTTAAKKDEQRPAAKKPAAARYDFDKADTNKDGMLSREEFNAMMKGQRAAAGTTTAPKAGTAARKDGERPADRPAK